MDIMDRMVFWMWMMQSLKQPWFLRDFPNTRFHGLGQHHSWRWTKVELLDEEKVVDEKEEPAKGGA
jgi:hypothetical protein